MFLAENLKAQNILIEPESRNRWDLFKEMVSAAVGRGDIGSEWSESVLQALVEREKMMSTGIGNGVAIPHCTIENFPGLVVLFALSSKGVSFNSIDGQPAKIVIMLIVPRNKRGQHVKMLASIARTLAGTEIKSKIMACTSADDIIQLFLQDDRSSRR